MSLNAKHVPMSGGGKKFTHKTVEAGTYPVRLKQIIDLGLQAQDPRMAAKFGEKPPAQTIMLTWELVDEFMEDEDGNEMEDKPLWISEEMPLRNLKSDLAKSTQRYKALDPKMVHDGDFAQLLGLPANALITTYLLKNGPNAGDERNKVESVTAMRPRDAQKCPESPNDSRIFVLDEPDLELFMSLPEFLQDKIKANLEYNGSELQKLIEGDSEPIKEKAPAKKKKEKAPEPEEEPDLSDDDDDLPWDD